MENLSWLFYAYGIGIGVLFGLHLPYLAARADPAPPHRGFASHGRGTLEEVGGASALGCIELQLEKD